VQFLTHAILPGEQHQALWYDLASGSEQHDKSRCSVLEHLKGAFNKHIPSTMRLPHIITVTLVACASATFGQHDALAAQGLLNLGLHVAVKGHSNSKTCSLKNLRVRKEWYVQREPLNTYPPPRDVNGIFFHDID
jgi:hypothetical protein